MSKQIESLISDNDDLRKKLQGFRLNAARVEGSDRIRITSQDGVIERKDPPVTQENNKQIVIKEQTKESKGIMISNSTISAPKLPDDINTQKIDQQIKSIENYECQMAEYFTDVYRDGQELWDTIQSMAETAYEAWAASGQGNTFCVTTIPDDYVEEFGQNYDTISDIDKELVEMIVSKIASGLPDQTRQRLTNHKIAEPTLRLVQALTMIYQMYGLLSEERLRQALELAELGPEIENANNVMDIAESIDKYSDLCRKLHGANTLPTTFVKAAIRKFINAMMERVDGIDKSTIAKAMPELTMKSEWSQIDSALSDIKETVLKVTTYNDTNTVHHKQSTNKSGLPRICQLFVKGKCKRPADKCRYLHVDPKSVPKEPAINDTTPKDQEPQKKKKLFTFNDCREWLKDGSCQKKNCPKNHEEAKKGITGKMECRDGASCARMTTCVFKHPSPTSASTEIQKPENNAIDHKELAKHLCDIEEERIQNESAKLQSNSVIIASTQINQGDDLCLFDTCSHVWVAVDEKDPFVNKTLNDTISIKTINGISSQQAFLTKENEKGFISENGMRIMPSKHITSKGGTVVEFNNQVIVFDSIGNHIYTGGYAEQMPLIPHNICDTGVFTLPKPKNAMKKITAFLKKKGVTICQDLTKLHDCTTDDLVGKQSHFDAHSTFKLDSASTNLVAPDDDHPLEYIGHGSPIIARSSAGRNTRADTAYVRHATGEHQMLIIPGSSKICPTGMFTKARGTIIHADKASYIVDYTGNILTCPVYDGVPNVDMEKTQGMKWFNNNANYHQKISYANMIETNEDSTKDIPFADLYKEIQCRPWSDADTIKQQLNKKMLESHPDKFPDLDEAIAKENWERYKYIKATLTDPNLRAAYRSKLIKHQAKVFAKTQDLGVIPSKYLKEQFDNNMAEQTTCNEKIQEAKYIIEDKLILDTPVQEEIKKAKETLKTYSEKKWILMVEMQALSDNMVWPEDLEDKQPSKTERKKHMIDNPSVAEKVNEADLGQSGNIAPGGVQAQKFLTAATKHNLAASKRKIDQIRTISASPESTICIEDVEKMRKEVEKESKKITIADIRQIRLNIERENAIPEEYKDLRPQHDRSARSSKDVPENSSQLAKTNVGHNDPKIAAKQNLVKELEQTELKFTAKAAEDTANAEVNLKKMQREIADSGREGLTQKDHKVPITQSSRYKRNLAAAIANADDTGEKISTKEIKKKLYKKEKSRRRMEEFLRKKNQESGRTDPDTPEKEKTEETVNEETKTNKEVGTIHKKSTKQQREHGIGNNDTRPIDRKGTIIDIKAAQGVVRSDDEWNEKFDFDFITFKGYENTGFNAKGRKELLNSQVKFKVITTDEQHVAVNVERITDSKHDIESHIPEKIDNSHVKRRKDGYLEKGCIAKFRISPDDLYIYNSCLQMNVSKIVTESERRVPHITIYRIDPNSMTKEMMDENLKEAKEQFASIMKSKHIDTLEIEAWTFRVYRVVGALEKAVEDFRKCHPAEFQEGSYQIPEVHIEVRDGARKQSSNVAASTHATKMNQNTSSSSKNEQPDSEPSVPRRKGIKSLREFREELEDKTQKKRKKSPPQKHAHSGVKEPNDRLYTILKFCTLIFITFLLSGICLEANMNGNDNNLPTVTESTCRQYTDVNGNTHFNCEDKPYTDDNLATSPDVKNVRPTKRHSKNKRTKNNHEQIAVKRINNDTIIVKEDLAQAMKDVVESVARAKTSTLTPIQIGYEHDHQGHIRYDPKCAICVQAKARSSCHKRQKKERIGIISFELAAVSKGTRPSLIATYPDAKNHGRAIIAIPLANKSTQEIRRAVVSAMLEFEQIWHTCTIVRTHSDKESGAQATKDDIQSQYWVRMTCTTGHDPQAYGSAEEAVALISGICRSSLHHVSHKPTREMWWNHAARHAGIAYSATKAHKDARYQKKDIRPFLAKIYAIKPSAKKSKISDKWLECCYLYPDTEVSGGHVVCQIMRSDGKCKVYGPFTTTSIRDCLDERSRFEICDIHDEAAIQNSRLTTTLQCKNCKKNRDVQANKATKFTNGLDFKCQDLQGVSCKTPENDEITYTKLKIGRKAKVNLTEISLDFEEIPEIHNRQPKISIKSVRHVDKFIEHGINSAEVQCKDEKTLLDEITAIPVVPKIAVTELCSKQEMESEEAIEAIMDEVNKIIFKYNSFKAPREFKNVVEDSKNDSERGPYTWSFCRLIVSIKNKERDPSQWKWKARIIVSGERIWNMSTNDVQVSAADPWSPCSRLESIRCTSASSLIFDSELRACDLESFYIQKPWPQSAKKHFLVMDSNMQKWLPKEFSSGHLFRGAHEMSACMYGHPLSGKFAVDDLLDFLGQQGWIGSESDPAWLHRPVASHAEMLSAYVDDLLAAVRKSSNTWSKLSEAFRFDISTIEDFPSHHLGTQMGIIDEGCWKKIWFSMEEYIASIVKAFSALFGEEATPCDTPITDDPRDYGTDTIPRAAGAEMRPVQSIIAMCLWCSRTCRWDICFAVCTLAGRITTWDYGCYKNLKRTVGYLRKASKICLNQIFHIEDKNTDMIFEAHGDADWHPLKPRSGFHAALLSERGSYLPVHAGNAAQPLVSDSTAISEIYAMYTTIKAILPISSGIECILGDSPLIYKGDNHAALTIAHRGYSLKTCIYSRATRIRMMLLKQLISRRIIQASHVDSAINRANFQTKVLGKIALQRERTLGGLWDKDEYPDFWCSLSTVDKACQSFMKSLSSGFTKIGNLSTIQKDFIVMIKGKMNLLKDVLGVMLLYDCDSAWNAVHAYQSSAKKKKKSKNSKEPSETVVCLGQHAIGNKITCQVLKIGTDDISVQHRVSATIVFDAATEAKHTSTDRLVLIEDKAKKLDSNKKRLDEPSNTKTQFDHKNDLMTSSEVQHKESNETIIPDNFMPRILALIRRLNDNNPLKDELIAQRIKKYNNTHT